MIKLINAQKRGVNCVIMVDGLNQSIKKNLKTKFELMLESRKLMKELDDFDTLTKIFIHGDPSQSDLSELEE